MEHTVRTTEDWRLETGRTGIWVFIGSEIMLFGGFFLAYALARAYWGAEMAEASRELQMTLGALNTLVLLVSSYLVAMAEVHGERGKQKLLFRNLWGAAALGFVFLVIKSFEYWEKAQHHHIPGYGFATDEFSSPGPAQLFYFLYFAGTGLHFLHLTLGVCWIAIWITITRSRLRNGRPIELGQLAFIALYWHFVDVVWVFLFPLFYLV